MEPGIYRKRYSNGREVDFGLDGISWKWDFSFKLPCSMKSSLAPRLHTHKKKNNVRLIARHKTLTKLIKIAKLHIWNRSINGSYWTRYLCSSRTLLFKQSGVCYMVDSLLKVCKFQRWLRLFLRFLLQLQMHNQIFVKELHKTIGIGNVCNCLEHVCQNDGPAYL